MSFETLKKEDLLTIAENYGVETKPTDTKAVIIGALLEDGVKWDDVAKVDKTVAEQDAVLKEEADVVKQNGPKQLLRMMRRNSSYEIRGIRFTKEHPFALVPEDDAEFITENDPEGFRYATPKEAAQYYG
jgi:hypothetical protein